MKTGQVFQKLFHNSQLYLNRNAGTILTCVGAAGVVLTAVTTVKATTKAIANLEEAKQEKGEELTTMEKARVVVPAYIPPVAVGMSAIVCIFGANMFNKKQQAALMSAYALLDTSFKDYKSKVGELYGEGVNKDIRTELAKDKYEESEVEGDLDDGKQLLYDEYSKRYFRATNETVLRAEYEVNKMLEEDCYVSLNDYYDLVGLDRVDYGDYVGWGAGQMSETWWTAWITFEHEKFEMDDGLEGYIITYTEPLFGYDEY